MAQATQRHQHNHHIAQEAAIQMIASAARILLMPQGTNPSELASRSGWVARACLERGWRYAPRLHIDLYGNTRGT